MGCFSVVSRPRSWSVIAIISLPVRDSRTVFSFIIPIPKNEPRQVLYATRQTSLMSTKPCYNEVHAFAYTAQSVSS